MKRCMCLLMLVALSLVWLQCTPAPPTSGEQQQERGGSEQVVKEATPREVLFEAPKGDAGLPLERQPEPPTIPDGSTRESPPESTQEDWSRAIVQTSYGPIQGELRPSGVHRFLGVPFAQAPTGEKRWQPPYMPKAWTQVRAVNTWPKACFQPPTKSSEQADGYLGYEDMSEDCLKLNVWAPSGAKTGAKKPVLVWIHGGGYTEGSTAIPSYHGENVAASGEVVVVSIQYRLGMLGFLTLSALKQESLTLDFAKLAIPDFKQAVLKYQGVSGNYGLMDQIAALHWIQQNIEAFGGDPKRVTIMGESAGGGSVAHLLVSPLTKPLFQKAILQSGLNKYLSFQAHESLGRALLQGAFAAHFTTTTPTDPSALQGELSSINKTLRATDASVLIEKSWLPWAKGTDERFGPHIGGALLPEGLSTLIRQKGVQDKPILIGTNLDEYSFFLTPEAFRAKLPRDFDATKLFNQILLSSVAKGTYTYQEASQVYSVARCQTISEFIKRAGCVYDEVSRMTRDVFKGFAHTIAGQVSQAYMYQFTRISPGSVAFVTLKASHGLEIPYVLRNLAFVDTKKTFYDTKDYELEATMSALWLSFVTSAIDKAPTTAAWTMKPYDTSQRFTEFGSQLSGKGLVSELQGYCDKGCQLGAKVVLESKVYNP